MSGAERASALALGAGFGVLGYVVPVMGVLLTIVIVLGFILTVVLGMHMFSTGTLADAMMSSFAVMRRLLSGGERAWLRRAPVIGLVGGGLVRWGQNLAVASGGA